MSVIVTGLSTDISREDLTQKLSELYRQPGHHFDDLCQQLFVTKQPFTLLSNLDAHVATANIEALTKIGLVCKGDAEEFGLSLVPIVETEDNPDICPACEKESGGGEVCQHCEICIAKFVAKKKFDENMSNQIRAAESSHRKVEQLEQHREEKRREFDAAKRAKAKAAKNAKNKARSSTPTQGTADARQAPVEDFVTVVSAKKKAACPYSLALQPLASCWL